MYNPVFFMTNRSVSQSVSQSMSPSVSQSVLKKVWKSPEKVLGNPWKSLEKFLRKSWKSPEKVMRMSWESNNKSCATLVSAERLPWSCASWGSREATLSLIKNPPHSAPSAPKPPGSVVLQTWPSYLCCPASPSGGPRIWSSWRARVTLVESWVLIILVTYFEVGEISLLDTLRLDEFKVGLKGTVYRRLLSNTKYHYQTPNIA